MTTLKEGSLQHCLVLWQRLGIGPWNASNNFQVLAVATASFSAARSNRSWYGSTITTDHLRQARLGNDLTRFLELFNEEFGSDHTEERFRKLVVMI
jgi:hypothetical protein